jgi:hypothetical protein
MGGIKNGVDMGLGAMIYIPSFIKTGPGIRKLIEGNSQTHRQHKPTSIVKIRKVG